MPFYENRCVFPFVEKHERHLVIQEYKDYIEYEMSLSYPRHRQIIDEINSQ